VIPTWFHRDLDLGAVGRDVDIVHRKVGVPYGDGHRYDETSAQFVCGLQISNGLPQTGEVTVAEATILGPSSTDGLIPDWYQDGPLFEGSQGWDTVSALLDDPVDVTSALKRFQGSHGIPPSGVVDETTAVMLSEGEVSYG